MSGDCGVDIGDGRDLPALRAQMERNAAAWPELLAQDLDPEAIFVRHRDDGSESRAARNPGSLDDRAYERDVSALHAQLDEDACARAWNEGRTMGTVRVLAYALDETD
jgi:hypothetical protein